MNFEHFIFYFTHHVESIIQWLFLAIIVLSGALVARTVFFKSKDEGTGGAAGVDAGDLKSTLQQILEQTASAANVPTAQPATESGSAPSASQIAELEALKKELKTREAELAQLKENQPSTGEAAKPSADEAALKTKIQELEAKLAEYEILEDDIADLSLYKEENTRLKDEIERLKNGGAAPSATTETPMVPTPGGQGEDIVAEFAQAVGKDVEAQDAVGAQDAAPAPPPEMPNTGDPVQDFESTVKMEKEAAATEVTPAPAAKPAAAPEAAAPPTPAPASGAASASAPAEGSDDLFAEFAQPEAEDNLDTDKMMKEMADLVSLTPTQENSVNDSIDTEKMAEEASSLQKTQSS